MKYKDWVAEEVEKLSSEIKHDKRMLKDYKKELKVQEQSGMDVTFLLTSIAKLEKTISQSEWKLDRFKRIQKIEPARLKTGAIISLSTLKAFHKKVSGRIWTTEVTQHPDGLKLMYTDGKAKGSLEITGFGVTGVDIPENVEIPTFEEGEILECLIQS